MLTRTKSTYDYAKGNFYFNSVHVLPDPDLVSTEFLDGYYDARRYYENYLIDGACFGKKRRYLPYSRQFASELGV